MSEPEVPVVPDTALPAPPVPRPRAPLTSSSPEPPPDPSPPPSAAAGPRTPDVTTVLLVATVLTLVTVLTTASVSLLVGWGPLGADEAADEVVGVTPHEVVDGPLPDALAVGVPAQVGAFTVAVTSVRGAPGRWVAAGEDAAPVRGGLLVRLRATFTGQGTGRPQQDLAVSLVTRDGHSYQGVPCRPAVAEDDVGAVLRQQDSTAWSSCVTVPDASPDGARLTVAPYGSQDEAEQVSWSLP